MMFIFIILIILALGAIVLLSRKSTVTSKTKEQFSKELARQVGGKIEALAGQENSYKLNFSFEGFDFLFEDLELKGFQEKIDKAYLKIRMKNKFTIIFAEHDRSTSLRGEGISTQPKREDSLTTMMKVYVPKQLSDLNIRTNDPHLANKIFEDSKVLAFFTECKNTDSRGYSSLALRIVDGEIILEFSSAPGFNPNIRTLRLTPGIVENYLDRMILVARKMVKLGYA